jgi:geranylgeranylglycerol-phosphate geranylgeranyltransferase
MLFSKKILAYIQISRPINALITFFAIIVACIISITENYSVLKIFLAGLSGALTATAGNVINDYFDIDIDRVNKPKRVLSSGKLSLKEALVFYVVVAVSSLLVSYFINDDAFVIVFIAHILLFFYSYRLKGVLLLGNFVIALSTGFAFIYGGVAVNNIDAALIPASFAFLINFIREVIKDMADVEGDKSQMLNTYPAARGFKEAKILVLYITAALILLTILPFVTELYRIEYFLIVMVVVNPLLVYIIKSLFKDDSIKNLNKLSNLLKLNMVIGLTAIFLGK